MARTIASTSVEEADHFDVTKIRPDPYNLLSNAALGLHWSCPCFTAATSLINWKNRDFFGFQSAKGLSLLFDPFVDAFLSVLASTGGAVRRPLKVLVISDYDTFDNVASKLSPGRDWAENETAEFFNPRGMGPSGDNLRKLIIGTSEELRSIQDFAARLRKDIEQRGILLWNYFPFLRGAGAASTGNWNSMLRKCNRGKLYEYLDRLLCMFVRCLDVREIVVGCSDELWGNDRDHTVLEQCRPVFHRINHPQVWAKQSLHGPAVVSSLGENQEAFDALFPRVPEPDKDSTGTHP